MKIAICFSGGIRSFLTCYPSIYKNIILPLNDVDIFFHLWSQPVYNYFDSSFNNFKFQDDECSQEKVYQILNKENKVKDYVINEYSPDWQDFIIKKCIDISYIESMNQKDQDYAISAISMYYKIKEANLLKINYENNNNFKYDLVIRARLDFKWNQQFNLNDFVCNDNEVILIKDSYCTKAKWMGNDKFFASSSKNMDNICNLFDLIKYFYLDLKIPLEGQFLNRHILKHLNLNIKFIGNQNSYEKILASKRIKINGLACFVFDCLDKYGYSISEDLLLRGFKVFGLSSLQTNNNNYKILSKYNNFELINSTDHIFSSFFVFTNHNDFINKINNKRIIYFTQNKLFQKTEFIKNLIFIDLDNNNLIFKDVREFTKIITDKNNFYDFNLSHLIS